MVLEGLWNWLRTDYWLWLLIGLVLLTRWLPGYLRRTRPPPNDKLYGSPEDKKMMMTVIKAGVFFVFFAAMAATFLFPRFASSPFFLLACLLGVLIFILGVPL